MDKWAESELAWELADMVAHGLSDRDRTRLYAAIGSGDSYTAIDTAMGTIASQGLPISIELVNKLATWLGAYALSGDVSRLQALLDTIESRP